jgi:hypothetical protein
VLKFEKIVTETFPESQKYSYEERGGQTVRVYSRAFTEAYALALNKQVERQMRASIKMIADFWYTAWVNAGQPDLSSLKQESVREEGLRPDPKLRVREHCP